MMFSQPAGKGKGLLGSHRFPSACPSPPLPTLWSAAAKKKQGDRGERAGISSESLSWRGGKNPSFLSNAWVQPEVKISICFLRRLVFILYSVRLKHYVWVHLCVCVCAVCVWLQEVVSCDWGQFCSCEKPWNPVLRPCMSPLSPLRFRMSDTF